MHHEEVIIISRCASGIGRYLAENLYREGHCLALTDANEKGLREAVTSQWKKSGRSSSNRARKDRRN